MAAWPDGQSARAENNAPVDPSASIAPPALGETDSHLPARADAFAGRFDWRLARAASGAIRPASRSWPTASGTPGIRRRRFGSWGPEPRFYPPLANLAQQSVEWQRERVVATAARFLGYGYQYHHIPDWNPPPNWPWKPTSAGHNGKGVDCSNLTSFVFNQGFGIRISSGIHRQADSSTALEAHMGPVAIRTIELPKRYDDRREILRTGDLLYIRGREDGPISHVVIWVGSVGRSASGVPLLIDSHGNGVLDDRRPADPLRRAAAPLPPRLVVQPLRQPRASDLWHCQRVSSGGCGFSARRLI